MVQAGFSYANHLTIAICDKMLGLRKELINMLTYLEVLERDSKSVGISPANDSLLSSGSILRQQSENVTI